MITLLLFFGCFCIVNISANIGFGSSNQDWGYVTVRDKAHMFWWLYYTSATDNYSERPLVIWLQGGPGGSSTGIGNFLEIGPLDVQQQERNISWNKYLNVLFVDNPVGTGYSYVEDNNFNLFAKDNTQIANDFLAFLKGFLNVKPEFSSVPIYIFGQSYGGKMAADIALLIHKETQAGDLNCNLTGIALGDSWISPIDSLVSWPVYLLNLGFIETEDYKKLTTVTDYIKEELESGNYQRATAFFHATQNLINLLTTVDYYNVLTKVKPRSSLKHYLKKPYTKEKGIQETQWLLKHLNISFPDTKLKSLNYYEPSEDEDDLLYTLMNGPVQQSLNLSHLPFTWGEQSNNVFNAVNIDFMKPVTAVVETILNETNISVSVYNGQLDLIVDTPGTVNWADALHWYGNDKWREVSRTAVVVNGMVEGFEKHYENFHFYWINGAGHSTPADNPEAMEYVLRKITNNYKVKN